MCGISTTMATDAISVLSNDDCTKLSKELSDSLRFIKHRGPDSDGKWISSDGRAALGFVRLSINDLTPGGEQPFMNEDKTIFAVVNGEIYNYDELKADLPESYKFKGQSDCEIVIPLYLQHGHSFVSKLRGEFALCLYDTRNHNFIAARDRYGVKPLFWTIVGNRLLVASEMKAFLPLGWEPEWDVKSIMEEGWIFDNRTIFKNVYKIRPGHILLSRGFGNIEQRQYWETQFADKHVPDSRSEEEIIEGVRNHLLDAIRIRLKADVPVALSLSGGIDSSAVAGIVKHLIENEHVSVGKNFTNTKNDRMTAFCIEFQGKNFNEAPIAKKTAEYLGINLEKILMTEQVYADHFESGCWHSEHHFTDLNYIGKFALNRLIQEKGFKVVLGGEGADEHFAGYPFFEADFFREEDKTWPFMEWDDFERIEHCRFRDHNIKGLFAGTDNGITPVDSALARTMLNGTSISYLLSWSNRVDFASWTKTYAPASTQENIANSIDGRTLDLIRTRWHPLHTAQYVWSKGPLANIILTCLGDRMEMAHGIEGRPPFLDHIFTEYVNNIPPALKIKSHEVLAGQLVEKWVLREAVKPFVLDLLYKRKKHPISAPIIFAEHGPLHKLLESLITRENIENLGFVEWEDVKGLTAAAFGSAKDQLATRNAFVIAQWVSLSKKFSVKTAKIPGM